MCDSQTTIKQRSRERREIIQGYTKTYKVKQQSMRKKRDHTSQTLSLCGMAYKEREKWKWFKQLSVAEEGRIAPVRHEPALTIDKRI